MKKVCLPAIAFLFVFVQQVSAQHQVTISGNVADSIDKKALSYVTAELYKGKVFTIPQRSTYTNEKGKFELSKIDTGHYTLIISSTGYAEKMIPVFIDHSLLQQNTGTIYLSPLPKNLRGVTITARKPLVEQSDDKIIYNAENDPMAAAETATDILRKTPLVSVDGNGNVSINGHDNFKVLLNGRETSLFARNTKEALQAFPGALIRKIEVITHPSAKYDAEGTGGLINIITKKKIAGYNGTIGATYNTQGYAGTNVSLNFKKNKLGIAGTLNTWNNIKLENKTKETILALQPIQFLKRITSGNGVSSSNGKFVNVEVSYDTDSLTSFVAYYNAGGGNFDGWNISEQAIYYAGNPIAGKNKYSVTDKNNYPNSTAGFDFIHKSRQSPERELSIKLNANSGKDYRYSSSILEPDNNSSDRYAINETNAHNKEYTLQADYIIPLQRKSKIETGAKIILRNAHSIYHSLIKYAAAEDYKINPANSDDFSYRQSVYSVYSTYNYFIKKYNFRIGIRMEHTDIDGEFERSAMVIQQFYSNLIPNLLVSTKFKNGAAVSLGYSLRLQRPFITNLNPFVNNSDSLFVSKGNPQLDAQLFHSLSFQYRISKGKTFINLNLTNSFSNNRIIQYSDFNSSTGITTVYPANIGKSMQASLGGSVSNSFGRWTFNSNLRLAYDFISNVQLSSQQNSGISGNINFNCTYKITGKLGTNAYLGINRSAISLQGKQSASMWYGCGFTYKFFKDKLNMIFNATNFHTRLFGIKARSSDTFFQRFYQYQLPFRGAGINLTWSFGKLKESNVSKKRGVINDDLIK